MNAQHKGTALYGMMGCGKTTLGKRLALHMKQPFTDTDALIEEKFGMSCADIIAENRDFPACQAAAVLAYSPATPEVVATGGSVARYPNLVGHLGRMTRGIFIFVDPDELEARLPQERIAALNNPDNLSFADLYMQRIPFYQAASDQTLIVPVGEAVSTTLANIIDMRSLLVGP